MENSRKVLLLHRPIRCWFVANYFEKLSKWRNFGTTKICRPKNSSPKNLSTRTFIDLITNTVKTRQPKHSSTRSFVDLEYSPTWRRMPSLGPKEESHYEVGIIRWWALVRLGQVRSGQVRSGTIVLGRRIFAICSKSTNIRVDEYSPRVVHGSTNFRSTSFRVDEFCGIEISASLVALFLRQGRSHDW
jgi:hypothetical protein